MFPLVK